MVVSVWVLNDTARHLSIERTVINIIHILKWIVRVIDNHRSSEAITVLNTQVRMIPECARLIGDGEVVQKGMIRSYRALVHESRPISPIGVLLKDAVPML